MNSCSKWKNIDIVTESKIIAKKESRHAEQLRGCVSWCRYRTNWYQISWFRTQIMLICKQTNIAHSKRYLIDGPIVICDAVSSAEWTKQSKHTERERQRNYFSGVFCAKINPQEISNSYGEGKSVQLLTVAKFLLLEFVLLMCANAHFIAIFSLFDSHISCDRTNNSLQQTESNRKTPATAQ